VTEKQRAVELLSEGVELLAEMQDKLYAQDRWALLLVFQAMDAAGKDGTIKHVMSGVNPQGCQVYSFKAPTSTDLDHDYLWRCMQCLPERGRIGIFNRSYDEEVLVVRVHPEILGRQKLPSELVTKDIWSIRLNTNWNMVGSVIQFLDFTPTETNFLGRNKRLSVHIGLQQLQLSPVELRDKLEIGQLYLDSRLLGSRLQLTEYVDLVFDGDLPEGGRSSTGERWVPAGKTGDLQGVYAYLRLTRPLFSLATEWGFDAYALADVRQVRRFVVNGSAPPEGEDSGLSLKTVAIEDGGGAISYLPRVHDSRYYTGVTSLIRSFGRTIKHDVTLSLGGYSKRFLSPDGFSAIFDAVALQKYRRTSLPRSEDAFFHQISYRTYQARYVQLRNVQTFALTEDFTLGHEVTAAVRFAANLDQPVQGGLGFIEASLDASYLWHLGGDLLWVWANAGTRWQPGLDGLGYRGPWANSSVGGGIRNISPRLWIGRLHAQVRTLLRENNLDNATSSLGSDTGLRGYGADQFEAPNLFQVNVEYRSLPINLYTLHLGFVVFYDGGAVWGPDPRNAGQGLPFRYHQSVGLGLRTHFPQFDKDSLRVDFGVPLSGAAGGVGTWFSFSFRQVF
jgi:hypothetical protein